MPTVYLSYVSVTRFIPLEPQTPAPAPAPAPAKQAVSRTSTITSLLPHAQKTASKIQVSMQHIWDVLKAHMKAVAHFFSSRFVTPVITRSKEGSLNAHLETKNLIIRSIQKEDLPFYVSLYANPQVMSSIALGETKSAEHVQKRVDTWLKRWQKGDPFSALIVLKKPASKDEKPTPIGHLVLGHGCDDVKGESDIAGMGIPEYQKKGFAKEAMTAVFKKFVPELKKFAVNQGSSYEAPLTTIHGTAQQGSASSHLMESVGMKPELDADGKVKVVDMYNGKRVHYYHQVK